MKRMPTIAGMAIVFNFRRGALPRTLLLGSEEQPRDAVKKTMEAVLDCLDEHEGWSLEDCRVVQAGSSVFADSPELIGRGFHFPMEAFISQREGGEPDRSLLGHVLSRLLSSSPGCDFLQKSGIALGDRYFERPGLRQQVEQAVRSHHFVLVEAIRRYGKTSLLANFELTPPRGLLPLYVSVESGSSPDFLPLAIAARLLRCDQLRKRLPDNLVGLVGHDVTQSEALDQLERTDRHPDEILGEIWASLSTRGQRGKKVVILLDELALHVDNVHRDPGEQTGRRKETQWKKWVGTRLDVLAGAPQAIRWVLAGSLHLPALLESWGIRHEIAASMHPLRLAPLDDADARTFLRLALLQERVLATDAEIDFLADRFGGWLPSFTLYMVDLIGRECRDTGELDLDRLEQLYTSLFSDQHRGLFSDLDSQPRRYKDCFRDPAFSQRLYRTLVAVAKAGDRGIDAASFEAAFHKARTQAGGANEERQRELLKLAVTVSENDFSLENQGGRYVMACPMLRDWALSRRREWRIN